jgi:hypothetical protein
MILYDRMGSRKLLCDLHSNSKDKLSAPVLRLSCGVWKYRRQTRVSADGRGERRNYVRK